METRWAKRSSWGGSAFSMDSRAGALHVGDVFTYLIEYNIARMFCSAASHQALQPGHIACMADGMNCDVGLPGLGDQAQQLALQATFPEQGG